MQLLVGRTGFEDANIPAAGKTDWGVDTISRRMIGHITKLADFIATLTQGDVYLFNGTPFYLQTWDPNEQAPIASITLNYKGLIRGAPRPIIETEIVSASGQTSADFRDENDGFGRIEKEIFPTVFYARAATFEFTYQAVQTRYRYIKLGFPGDGNYSVVESGFTPVIEKGRVTTDRGFNYGMGFAGYFSLTPHVETRRISFKSNQIVGTPFYECEDVVRKYLEGEFP